MTKRTRTVLIASLILNVLLIGGILGFVIGQKPSIEPVDRFIHRFEKSVRVVPEEHKAYFNARIEELNKNKMEVIKKIGENRKRNLELLLAKDFDADAFKENMHEMEKYNIEMRNYVTEAMADILSKLDQETREKLTKSMMPPIRNGRKHFKWKHNKINKKKTP